MKILVTDTNIHIKDSYKVSKNDFDFILNDIENQYPDNDVLKNRSRRSLKNEWAVHNFLYLFHIERNRTADVDLNYPQSLIEKILYNAFGWFSMLCIP